MVFSERFPFLKCSSKVFSVFIKRHLRVIDFATQTAKILYRRCVDYSYYEKIGNELVCIDHEIPFDIPNGWGWCRGISCFSGMETKRPIDEYFDYIDIDSIDNKNHKVKQPKHLITKDAPNKACQSVNAGSVLFSFVRPSLKNIAYIEDIHKNCIASTGFYVCNSNGTLHSPFMYYLMISEYVVQGLN